MKQWFADYIWPGLKILSKTIAYGILLGSLVIAIYPSVTALAALVKRALSRLPNSHFGNEVMPWLHAFSRPHHLWLLTTLILGTLLLIRAKQLANFLFRCFNYCMYEGTVVWIVCTAIALLNQNIWLRIFTVLATLLLTGVIAYLRTSFLRDERPTVINADCAVARLADDRLGRVAFIDSLTKRVLDDSAPVIAVIGAYGDGKTTVLNFLAEKLHQRGATVVHFQSSLPGNEASLVSSLFNDIGKHLHQRFFTQPLSRTLGRVARTFSGLIPKAPSGLQAILADPSQDDILNEFNDRLNNLPVRKVVVLLDDMDRMQGPELRTLLKIIRAADEYPKLSFVCAFYKKALVDALIRHQVVQGVTLDYYSTAGRASGQIRGQWTSDDTHAGYEYLEKFFPVQIPVPKLDDVQAGKEFDDRFNQFAKANGLPQLPEDTSEFDKAFGPLWTNIFRYALTNLRKINAYFNALNSSYGLIKDEVNLLDFMCIELLRQTQPDIYDKVFRHRSLFYFPEWDVFKWGERTVEVDKGKAKQRRHDSFTRLFQSLYGEEREFTLSLLAVMFPKVEEFYDEERGARSLGAANDSEAKADSDKRIYHPDHFGTYYSLHVPEGYVSTQELKSLLDDASQIQVEQEAKEFFANYLHKQSGNRRYRLFTKLTRFEAPLEPAITRALALAIAAESDTYQHDDLEIGEYGSAIRAELVLANRLKDGPGITELLKDVIVQSSTDSLAIRVFQFSIDRESNKIFDRWDFVGIEELKGAFAHRMKSRYFPGGEQSIYAPSTTFRDWQALFTWANIGDEAKNDVKSYLRDEFTKRPWSIGKHISWLIHSLDSDGGKKAVDGIFPLKELAAMARNQDPTQWSKNQQKFVTRIIKDYGGSDDPTV